MSLRIKNIVLPNHPFEGIIGNLSIRTRQLVANKWRIAFHKNSQKPVGSLPIACYIPGSKLHKAFTIVELLIVVVIIGILASITITSFSTVTTRANSASIQSDLINAKKQILMYQVQNGSYPTLINDCPSPAAANLCLKTSNGGTFSYTVNNAATPPTFSLTETLGTIAYSITDSTTPTQVPYSLYAFTSFTFTSCGASGQSGPTLANCQASYSTQSWASNTNYFNVSSGAQIWTVPANGTYQLEVWGAQGGNGYSTAGGSGGYSIGSIILTQGQQLNIYVGQPGTNGTTTVGYTAPGGFNGGGSSVNNGNSNYNGSGAGGGGASDVRLGGFALGNRIIVAGGGGGGGSYWDSNGNGGSGGGTVGGSGSLGGSWNVAAGGGTSSTGGSGGTGAAGPGAPGSFGIGADCPSNSNASGGGGGGGYYGGGSGARGNSAGAGGGGGGSGYVGGVNGGSMSSGVWVGSGKVTITKL